MLSRISYLGGWKIWGRKCCLESRIWGVENLGRKMLSRISYLGGWKIWGRKCYLECEKFGVENAISNLEFGGWKIWGVKCCLESRIWGVENLGRKMLSRISNLGGGKFGMQNAISNFFHPPNSRFEIAFSTQIVHPLKLEFRDSIFHPKSSTHPNWRFEIAFSAPNFPPPKFEIAFSIPNFPPPKFEIRDSIFRPKYSTPLPKLEISS